jgi:AraC-like DNA-binding protein
MRTRDVDEAIAAVASVYCPHSIKVTGRASGLDSELDVLRVGAQPLIHLSYGAPVEVDAEDFSQLFLALHSLKGHGTAQQDGQRAEWGAGQTLLFSANRRTKIVFDQLFSQNSVRLDNVLLEQVCARWLGHPLKQGIRFDLSPFAPRLQRVWSHAVHLLLDPDGCMALGDGRARRAFDEYLISLLLQTHAHNYSEELHKEVAVPAPSIVRLAERLIREKAAAPVSVVELAADLDVSVRTLQAALRTWRSTTPSAYLRQIRLERAHDTLLNGDASLSVTEIAFQSGFTHLGRFAATYGRVYGEHPSETRARRRRSMRSNTKPPSRKNPAG